MVPIDPLYVVSGLAVGTLVGMTGVGGGSLMTPLLILLFGIHPATAVGTDLLYAATTKSVGTAVHGWNRTVDWRLVGTLAAGSVPLTILTILILSLFRLDAAAVGGALTSVLGVALVLTAVSLFCRGWLIRRFGAGLRNVTPRTRMILTILMGAVLGVLVTMSSVGAGAIGVTALILLYPDMPSSRIVGSDIAHAVPLTLIAGLGHWFLGSINFALLGSLLIGSIPGIILGSHAAVKVSDSILRPILALTLLAVAVRLLLPIVHINLG
ncbi:MAG TPA: sulfite exporter TauE/SafE family protein [Stellaceae bacterium]|nr:sulfite exporter TauE/SafE family protein [Stellaceae bacterium]